MKRGIAHYFLGIGFLVCFVLAACGTVSPKSYADARAQPRTIPPGRASITQTSLAGEWRSEAGDTYTFRGNTFQSNVLNKGKPGAYEINPVLSSDLIVFYRDQNVEGSALFGGTFFFERNDERDSLASFFAVLSEDGQTLILGEKTFVRVGR
jgi:hypothetical protein